MSTTTKQYDGDLAVAAVALAFVLTATQIGFVADGLMMVNGQGLFLSLLFAIVIATGLLHSQFVLNRLWQKTLPRGYAWCFCGLTAAITGIMAVWSMTLFAEAWTFKWFFCAFLGALVPLETLLLANMTTEMFSLAGKGWYKGSISEKIVAVVQKSLGEAQEVFSVALPPMVAHTTTEEVVLAPFQSPAIKIESTSNATFTFDQERVALRVTGEMSKRKWKDLHSELRRVGFILWDAAEKSQSQDGGREYLLSGKILFPANKGKKHKQKRENARTKHIEMLLEQLKSVVHRYN